MQDDLIADIAKALVSSDGVIVDCAGMAPYLRLAEAAHSVIAGKVAELTEALGECQDKLWVLHFGLKDDAERKAAISACNMAAAALAPYPERRSE